jgi:hypothetical protein
VSSTASEAPVPAAGAERPARATEPEGPVVAQVAAGAIVIDGTSDDWAALKMRRWNVLPPRPVKGEPRGMGERFALRQWAHTAETAEVHFLALAHDEENLYVILQMPVGIKEKYEKTHATGALGYLCLDLDGDASTGQQETLYGKTAGFDCKLWLPTGFYGALGEPAKPMAAYEVTCFENGKFEEVPGAEKETHEAPDFIAFAGNFIEMRIPYDVLTPRPGATLKLAFDHMGLSSESAIYSFAVE